MPAAIIDQIRNLVKCHCNDACAPHCEVQEDTSQDAFDHIRNLVKTSSPSYAHQWEGMQASPRGGPFDVELRQTGKYWRSLGLTVSPDDDPAYLMIDDIKECTGSLIGQWNATHGRQHQVIIGDVIKSVNGNTCDAVDMCTRLEACVKDSVINLLVEPRGDIPRNGPGAKVIAKYNKF